MEVCVVGAELKRWKKLHQIWIGLRAVYVFSPCKSL